jgi:glutamyl-tRNA reductase
MRLDSLRIVHLLKEGSSASPYEADRAFVLDSCQRKLWVGIDSKRDLPSAPYEIFRGIDAYAFLLSVATGLESQVVGETDIFGQIKEAWKQQSEILPTEFKKELSPWIQRLFEDTKEIRSLYLQNIGGSSYGSLLRKLLKDHQSLAKGPTLLIGAGQLAHSVAPYLMDHELLISNRTPLRAQELAFELQEQNTSARVRALVSQDEELSALSNAAQVIVCVPLDPQRDARRIAALGDSRAHIVHLGMRASETSAWTSMPGFHSLDEIFQIEKSVTAIRSIQVEKARSACREKSMLRALGGGSTSISHGWEDLAAFGS